MFCFSHSTILHPPSSFRAVSVAEMRELDRQAMEEFGIPGAVLMENAGRAVAEAVGTRGRGTVAVFCGSGNNGGDGLVAARYLANQGQDVRLVLAHPPDRFTGDAWVHWQPVEKMKIPFLFSKSPQKLLEFIGRPRAVVDALLGTGARSPLQDPYKSLIVFINTLPQPVVAVDVPSGLNADTGQAQDVAVKAETTVTMGLPKRGLISPSARPWVGRLRVADIGFPRQLVAQYKNDKGARN